MAGHSPSVPLTAGRPAGPATAARFRGAICPRLGRPFGVNRLAGRARLPGALSAPVRPPAPAGQLSGPAPATAAPAGTVPGRASAPAVAAPAGSAPATGKIPGTTTGAASAAGDGPRLRWWTVVLPAVAFALLLVGVAGTRHTGPAAVPPVVALLGHLRALLPSALTAAA